MSERTLESVGIVALYTLGGIILISFLIMAKSCFQIRRVYRRDPGRVIQVKFNYETNLHEISDAV